MGISLKVIYFGGNELADFLGRSSKKFLDFHQLEKVIIPGNAVFLNDILYVLIFAAQGLDFYG